MMTETDLLPESQQDTVTISANPLKVCLAENSASNAELLAELSQDRDAQVRLAVAENPSTPHCLLELLALDEDADVRYGMAANAQMPAGILILLAQDENPYVSNRASKTMSSLARQGVIVEFPLGLGLLKQMRFGY